MAVVSKAEALEWAENVRKLVDALVSEGFDKEWAQEFVKTILTPKTTLF